MAKNTDVINLRTVYKKKIICYYQHVSRASDSARQS